MEGVLKMSLLEAIANNGFLPPLPAGNLIL